MTNAEKIAQVEEQIENLGGRDRLPAYVGYSSRFRDLLRQDDEGVVEKFDTLFGGVEDTRAPYIALRDELRDELRKAEQRQRLYKELAHLIKKEDGGDSYAFRYAYDSRMHQRQFITRLIRLRRAGKAWSRAQSMLQKAQQT